MEFTTKIKIPTSDNKIDFNSKILSLGSCFAENIGTKLDYFKFQNQTNPFGIIFNTVSIENLISRVVYSKPFTENDIFFYNDLWNSYEVHSELSDIEKDHLLLKLNETLLKTKNQLQEATHLFITYGTSWVYQQIESKQIVANCHKVPQKNFNKLLLSIEQNQKAIENTIQLIRSLNQTCEIVFTISPVRHLKDGFIENQRGKSHLITALHTVLDKNLPHLTYFPSYEIMIDELRDYRFYTDDLLHPNVQAINYIWERFKTTYLQPETELVLKEIDIIQKSLAHKAFNPNSESHQKFEKNLRKKITTLVSRYPHIHF